MSNKIIRIEYKQELVWAEDGHGWTENYEVSISVLMEALTSGWLAQFTGHHGGDLAVLFALALHGRPLRGKTLAQLVEIGAAVPADEGRLVATVSDVGLADELKTHRHTIASATERLAASGKLNICYLTVVDANGRPKPLIAESGQYKPNKMYVLSGEVSRIVNKRVNRVENLDMVGRVENLDTVGRVENLDTVHARAVSKFSTSRVENPATNIKQAGAAALSAPDFSDEALSYFLALKKGKHLFSEKELKALADLRQRGYTLPEITAGIDKAFARPGGCRHFTLAANIVKDAPPQAVARSQPEPTRSESPEFRGSSTGEATPRIQPESETRPRPETTQPEIPPELTEVVETFRAYGLAVTPAVVNALKGLSDEYDDAALKHDSTGAAWVTAALTEGQGIADKPIPYARTILARWAKEGPGTDNRPKAPPPAPTPPKKPRKSNGSNFQDALDKVFGGS